MDKRKQGLEWCKQVANFLRLEGYTVDGPFSKVIFTKGRKMASHVDIFGVYDLISIKEGIAHLHQVTAINMKSNKIKKMRKLGAIGLLWCYCILDTKKPGFRRFVVSPGSKPEVWETSSIII